MEHRCLTNSYLIFTDTVAEGLALGQGIALNVIEDDVQSVEVAVDLPGILHLVILMYKILKFNFDRRSRRSRELEREHEKERKRKGLPEMKKEHLSGNF